MPSSIENSRFHHLLKVDLSLPTPKVPGTVSHIIYRRGGEKKPSVRYPSGHLSEPSMTELAVRSRLDVGREPLVNFIPSSRCAGMKDE